MKKEFIERFNLLGKAGESPAREVAQSRGLDFEALVNDVAQDEGILLQRSYHTDDNSSEQIDGAVEVLNRVFLLEVKWVKSNLAASELYSFIGKIENKFHGTLGVFVSRNPLTENFITALNRGRRQSVIVVHGGDVDLLFSAGGPKLADYLGHCFKVLSYDNRTHIPVAEYMKLAGSRVRRGSPGMGEAAKEFIRRNLTGTGTFSPGTAITEFRLLEPDDRQLVYDFALRNMREVVYNAREKFDYRTYTAYSGFFSLFTESSEEVTESIELYFDQRLMSDFEVYSDAVFLRLYIDHLKDLSAGTASKLEKFIVDYFHQVFDQWDSENKLTEIIRRNWAFFSPGTQDALKKIYLEIYISKDRQDRFAQKQFASFLLKEGITTQRDILAWLGKKFQQIREQYTGAMTSDVAAWFGGVYAPVVPYLEIDNWYRYVADQLTRE